MSKISNSKEAKSIPEIKTDVDTVENSPNASDSGKQLYSKGSLKDIEDLDTEEEPEDQHENICKSFYSFSTYSYKISW